ncbi:MAG: hypothetical protein Kow0074_25680 [Candidatus Zixiibacteriota bacterium]
MRTLSDPRKIRPPHFARRGGFYTDNPVDLAKEIAGYYRNAKRIDFGGAIVGLVCPHAGYAYSGQIAADAYKQLEGLSYDTVIVISPSHQVFFPGASVYSGGAYRTPLGDVPLDLDLCEKLTSVDKVVTLSDIGHDASGGGYEHALEVHLPFLQVVLGSFALVPIVMGDQEFQTAKKLGELIGRYAKPGRTLVVASSDLAHGHSYAETRRLDEVAAASVQAFDANTLYDRFRDGAFEACGGGPITAAMIAAQAMGADSAKVITMRNSGDVTGEKTGYIVGYLSAVFYRSTDKPSVSNQTGRHKTAIDDSAARSSRVSALASDHQLNDGERSFLLRTARKSLAHAVKGANFECPGAPTERLREKRGVFVTLKQRGQLRGCIGYVRPYKPLVDAVWEMAESAALRDDRFVPLDPREVDTVTIEITVLSPLKRITNPDDVLVGRHGLLITRGYQSGVLLPQVPVEAGWDRETFLEQTCLKAGLPPDAWRDPETIIEVFTAEVFHS